jgi:hypothetical protein
LPPANGFAGSAVWQLAQPPAIVSPLPRAMVSADGSDRAMPRLNAVHKSTMARIAGFAQRRPCTGWSPVGRSIARNRGDVPQLVSNGVRAATQSEKLRGGFRHEIAKCRRGTGLPRFVMRGLRKST